MPRALAITKCFAPPAAPSRALEPEIRTMSFAERMRDAEFDASALATPRVGTPAPRKRPRTMCLDAALRARSRVPS